MNLEELTRAVHNKYASFIVEFTDMQGLNRRLELKSLLLIGEKQRESVLAKINEIKAKKETAEADLSSADSVSGLVSTIVDFLVSVSGSSDTVDALIEAIKATGDDPLGYLAYIMEQYNESTQAGEA